ncbi:MAG TPA: TetR/AcrR family transcriptional regulator [Prolixibacteraceae bacterium]|nr:TetR/AcrR family transcriptional regulator [Prolixibacteraceae bacterium]
MKNKEIQEKRMKDYFIQATKDILKAEGITSLSVRNIADQAGYSYATLYHYFKDVNDLIFLCVHDFQEECHAFVRNQTKKSTRGMEKIRATVLAYMQYFVEYPGIFELFYLVKVGDFGGKQSTLDVISHSLDRICEEEWVYCIHTNVLTENQTVGVKEQLKFGVVGLLLFYLNRRTPDSYTLFMDQARRWIGTVLVS